LALRLSSLLKLTVAYLCHLKLLSSLPLFAKTFGVSSPIVFHTAFIFVRSHIALLSWRYFMATEIPPFGLLEPNLTFERDCREAARVSPSNNR
jgi:hypothetical protein